MKKYKLCPDCGFHNNPLAIECEECGEDLSSVRILDEQTEEQLAGQAAPASQLPVKKIKMVRICEECGTKNEPQARKCMSCGEDISMVIPVLDDEQEKVFSLASIDGEYTFHIPRTDGPVVIGRENEMQDHLKNCLFVSRRHAELFFEDGKLKIRSFETATNGTHVNGVQINPGEAVPLNGGDVIGLGGNDAAVQKEAAYFKVLVS